MASNSLFPRWLAVALVLAISAVVAVGGWFYRTQAAFLRDEAEMRLAGIARLKSSEIAAWRQHLLADAAVITGCPVLSEQASRLMASAESPGAAAMRKRLQLIANNYGYSSIFLTDSRARVRLAVGNDADRTCTGMARAVTRALAERRPLLTEVHLGADGDEAHIGAVSPIFPTGDQDDAPAGAIVACIGLQEFIGRIIESWPTPSLSAEMVLVQRDGDSVLFLNELRHRKNTALKLRIPRTREDVTAVMAVNGRRGVIHGKDYRGIEVLSAIRAVPGTPWLLLAEMDVEEVFATWRFRSATILAVIALLVLGTVAGAISIWQHNAKSHYRALAEARGALFESETRLSATLRSIGDGVISTDAAGIVTSLNTAAEHLTGWSAAEAAGRPIREVFRIVDSETGQQAEDPVARAVEEGRVVALADHTVLIARDGVRRRVADSCAPIRDASGAVLGAVLVFRDTTEQHRIQQLAQTRMNLLDFATTHSLDEVLTKALDDITALAESPVGFYHFVDSDQKTIIMQQWSTRTVREFCRAEGKGLHYDVEKAGAWADCLRLRKPVVHNDYASLPHKRGLPEGHARVIRELVVPVMREDRVVAVLCVGNKPTDYTERDVETVSYLADVTWEVVKQKRAEQALVAQEERYRALWQSAVEGFCLSEIVQDADGRAVDYRIVDVNAAYEAMTGVRSADSKGRLASDIYGASPPPYLDVYARVASTRESRAFETFLESAGRHFSVSAFSPSPGQCATSWSDVSERKAYEHELQMRSVHDPLTGLLNRQGFEERLGERLETNTGRGRSRLVVLFLDLDKFKIINDAMGHKVGDMLLVEVSRRLQSCLRSDDALARIGGDEFTAILSRCQRRSSAESVASRMLDVIGRPFDIQGHRFVIGASIGMAACPADGDDAGTLLKRADAAMYRAKQDDGVSIRWFSCDVDKDDLLRLELEADIRTALEQQQFRVCYQPIVRLADGSVHGAEALLRWEHPEKGMISPCLFIPIAERIGLMGAVGDWVLRSACGQAANWSSEGLVEPRMSVNVSAAQLREPGWLDSVRTALLDSGLAPEYLDLEITESDLSEDNGVLAEVLREARTLGIGICIDDFGVGQSSLSRFRDFPVTGLKIDGSFVIDVEHSPRDRALLQSIIDMARAQSVHVTAEWVETEAQMKFLHNAGCDFAQGYAFGPPLLPDKFREFAAQRASSTQRGRRAA